MRKILAFIGLSLSIFSASCNSSFETPEISSGNADFTRVIAIGDNFLSGYQNDALAPHNQQHSIGALLCKQFQLLGAAEFNQPSILFSGGIGINNKPWVSVYNQSSYLGFKTDCEGVSNFFPYKNSLAATDVANYLASNPQTIIKDYAIPFARIGDFTDAQFGSISGNIYYHHFCSAPSIATVLDDALAQHPTFVICNFGMEDIFQFARNGGKDVSITPAATFNALLDSALKKLTAFGAKGVIGKIPALDVFPFYNLIPPRGLNLTQSQADSLNQLTGLNLYNVGENGFFIEYPKNSGNYRQMGAGEHILLDIPTDSLKCYSMGVIQPIPDRYVLDSAETKQINDAIVLYNNSIINKATNYGFAISNIDFLFNKLKAGVIVNGVKYTNEYIKGGFFSLDGYHPNEKGYSIMAQYFLDATHDYFGTQLPKILCEDCIGIQFP